MTTITQRKKLSKGTWVLIFLALAALIAVIVLAAVGFIDLNFLVAPYDLDTNTSGLLVGYAIFGTYGWMNAVIIIVLPFITGIVVCFLTYRYFIGQKVTTTLNPGSVYNPGGQTVSNPQQSGTDTVIS